MKPIIIIKETNKDGKFELTEKELKELIEQAYEQGFEDGKAQYQPTRRDIVLSDKPCTPTLPRDSFYNHITPCGETVSKPGDNPAVYDTKLADR